MGYSKPIVFLDFDGTLAEYNGWDKNGYAIGKPLPNALEGCQNISKKYVLKILTARNDHAMIKEWLKEYQFQPMQIFSKPSGNIYVDDRGYRFGGDWKKTESDLMDNGTSPWWSTTKE